MSYRFLSHTLSNRIPVYGGYAAPDISEVKSISRGDSANVFSFSMQNHWGTHIDAPNHFFEKGKKISDYPADFWIFKAPTVVKLHLGCGDLLVCGEWIEKIHPETDLVLFQAGWSGTRNQEKYILQNPGIHPETGAYLRGRYPKLRAIGIDWISVSSYKNREIGREAHKAFLNPDGPNAPILIIEDMDLSGDLSGLKEVCVIPLRIDSLDSAPCTVIGFCNN